MKDPIKRRQTVSWKKLCFNCLKYGHRAADCPPRTWFKCNRKHHKSLCVNNQLQDSSSIRHQETKEKMMLPLEIREFATLLWLSMQLQFSVEPQWTLVLEVATPGAGSSYASVPLISCIGKSPVIPETRQMEMLLHTASTKIEVHNLINSN